MFIEKDQRHKAVSAGGTWSLIFGPVQNVNVGPAQKEGLSAVKRSDIEACSFLISSLLTSLFNPPADFTYKKQVRR